MCSVDVYEKYHVPITNNTSSGCGISMPNTPSKEALISLGQTINFIENWFQ